MACPSFDPSAPYVTSVVTFVDCKARQLGAEGYQTLASATGTGTLLQGLVTIFIALIGYRLLLGDRVELRDGVIAAVKIGIVVTLATQWAAFRPLIYDVVVASPEQLAAQLAAPTALGSNDPESLAARVQGVYGVLDAALRPPPLAPGTDPNAGASVATAPAFQTLLSGTAGGFSPQVILQAANAVFALGAMAGMLAPRVVAGLLLALGPIFAASFLFDATRGLFIGWLRGLIAAALAAAGSAIVIAIALAIVEPQVRLLGELTARREPVILLPGEIFASAGLFALILLALFAAVARVAAGLKLTVVQSIVERAAAAPRIALEQAPLAPANFGPAIPSAADAPPSRAAAIASAVATAERRELVASRIEVTERQGAGASRTEAAVQTVSLGQQGRRERPRRSSAAAKRDQR